VKVPARAQHPVDDTLVSRQIEAVKECGENSIKPLKQRKRILENPDYDDYHGPIG
jgi:hypothetical protein